MNRKNSLNRPLMSVIMLASSLCLAQPSHAGDGAGLMRQMQQANPGMSNREIRQMMKDSTIRPVGETALPQLDPTVNVPVQRQLVTERVNSHVENRLQKLSDRSAFIRENGRAKAVVNGIELDLTSGDRSIVLGKNLFLDSETRSIKVGNEQRTLASGDRVTAAEYVALQQVINDGAQGLNVDLDGRGIGGAFNLSSISDGGNTIRANQLVIPEFVTVSGDFSKHSDGVRVTNDLVNFGSINAFSSNKQVDTARIAARDITNNSGATIATSAEKLNLSLRADRDINNAGSISASGDLDLSAGRSINNSGLISSNANITLNGNADADLVVNNTGGMFSAQNGAINLRAADFNGAGNTTVYGGDLISRELNLFTGLGTTDVFVNQLTGVVNSSGSAAHVRAKTDMLTIGSQCLVGDPTYYNVGDIQITGDVIVGEKLAIIASGNISRTAGNTAIRAQGAGGEGFDITIIAGANITGGTDPSSTIPGTQATGDVTIDGASSSGGNIDFNAPNLRIDSSAVGLDQSGGNVIIAAYAGSGGGQGIVSLQNGGIISTYGLGNGNNGGVKIVAGGTGLAINLGAQILAEAGQGTSGDILLVTAQPAFSSGTTMTFDTTGAITSGNTIVPSAAITQLASITTGGSATIKTNGGNVLIQGDNVVTIQAPIFSNNSSSPLGVPGNIDIVSNNQVTVSALLSARGGTQGYAGEITVVGNSTSPLSVLAAIADGANGGFINIFNGGLGGVQLSGIFNADGTGGDTAVGGSIQVTTPGTIESLGSTITANGGSSAPYLSLIYLDASQIIISGTTTISALGSTRNIVSLKTSVNGISADGMTLSATSSGQLSLFLANNILNANSTSGNGGTIYLEGGTIGTDTSATNPLLLTANGFGAGNGGNVTYIDHSTTATVIGVPLKEPKFFTNYLGISANAGAVSGDGGHVTVDVDGDLLVNGLGIEARASQNAGPHNGGKITLSAGNAPSSKVGKLIIVGNLNADGINGGAGGEINLSSAYTKAFTIGGTKAPKNGIQGTLSAIAGKVSVKSANGISLLASDGITTTNVSLEAAGKGKISAAKGVVLNGDDLRLIADNGSIALNTQATRLDAFTNSFLYINNDSAALSIPIGSDVTANGGVEIINSGNITYQKILVLSNGDIILHSLNGGIGSNSGSQLVAAQGSITLQAENKTTGYIWTANGGSMRTFGGKKAGDITLAIGDLPKKPITRVPQDFQPSPSEFTVTNNGKGQTYFGENPTAVHSDGLPFPTSLTANDKKIIFNNQSTGGQLIDFSGNNQIVTNSPI